jgi:hypothetical protein
MSFGAPMEHDLYGLRENFYSSARWLNAIEAARAMSWFAKSNGVNNVELALNCDDEGDNGNLHGSPEADTKRQQQHLSPPSLDDRAPRDGLAGLVAKGLQRRRRLRHRPPQYHFLILSKRPRFLPRPKRRGKGVHPMHRWRRRPSHVNGGG